MALCPAFFSSGRTLYQHHAPCHAPAIRMKVFTVFPWFAHWLQQGPGQEGEPTLCRLPRPATEPSPCRYVCSLVSNWSGLTLCMVPVYDLVAKQPLYR